MSAFPPRPNPDPAKPASPPASFRLPLSLYEANRYYHGLYSRPVLVARTGAPWKLPSGPEAYTPQQKLRSVGNHPLQAVWDNLAPQIHGILEAKGVEWTSTDVVRIGAVKECVAPVIVWIGVKPSTLSGTDGLAVAKECKQLLVANEILDVEVQIRESVVTRYLGPKLMNPPFLRSAELSEPLTTTLGSPICSNRTSCVDGTSGFYVADDNSKLYLVTARHVLFEPNPANNNTYEHNIPNEPRINVALFGIVGFNGYIERIKCAIGGMAMNLEYEERCLKSVVKDADKAERERRVKKIKDTMVASKRLYDDVMKDWSNLDDRILGHVRFSPPIEHGAGPRNYTQDYALIEIDTSKIDAANFTGNVIDVGDVIELVHLMNGKFKNVHAFEYPHDCLFKVKGIIPDEEMLNPTMLDRNNDPCLFVMKRGISSGLTVGRANSIWSYVRNYYDNGDTRVSKEWAVISDSDKFYDPFSEKGDSGSGIVDCYGRLGGLLTGGAGNIEDTDITYATPVCFILDSLKANGYNVTLAATIDA